MQCRVKINVTFRSLFAATYRPHLSVLKLHHQLRLKNEDANNFGILCLGILSLVIPKYCHRNNVNNVIENFMKIARACAQSRGAIRRIFYSIRNRNNAIKTTLLAKKKCVIFKLNRALFICMRSLWYAWSWFPCAWANLNKLIWANFIRDIKHLNELFQMHMSHSNEAYILEYYIIPCFTEIRYSFNFTLRALSFDFN